MKGGKILEVVTNGISSTGKEVTSKL